LQASGVQTEPCDAQIALDGVGHAHNIAVACAAAIAAKPRSHYLRGMLRRSPPAYLWSSCHACQRLWHRASAPIPLPNDGELRALRDAATYITELQEREHGAPA